MGPGDGQTVANPAGGGLNYKARSGQTAGALTAWESTAAPGEGPPLHLHVNEDEFMYVLEVRLLLRLAETDHTAPAGSIVFIPRGVPHTWQNAGDGHARILFVSRRRRPAWSASSSVPRSCPRTRGWQMPSRLSRATPAWRFSVLCSPDLTLGAESFGLIAQPAVPRDVPPRRGTPPLTGQRVSRKPAVTCPDRTRSIRAAKPLLARLLHRQSVGALTGRAAFPSHGLLSRNRLEAVVTWHRRGTAPVVSKRLRVWGSPPRCRYRPMRS